MRYHRGAHISHWCIFRGLLRFLCGPWQLWLFFVLVMNCHHLKCYWGCCRARSLRCLLWIASCWKARILRGGVGPFFCHFYLSNSMIIWWLLPEIRWDARPAIFSFAIAWSWEMFGLSVQLSVIHAMTFLNLVVGGLSTTKSNFCYQCIIYTHINISASRLEAPLLLLLFGRLKRLSPNIIPHNIPHF